MEQWSLPAEPTSPMEARTNVRRLLTAWEVDGETVLDAELLVSELVSNAVIHARSPVELEVRREKGSIHISVQDGGAGRLHPRSPGPEDPTGRGLLILDRVASRWEVATQQDNGKTVHFWLDRAPVGG